MTQIFFLNSFIFSGKLLQNCILFYKILLIITDFNYMYGSLEWLDGMQANELSCGPH